MKEGTLSLEKRRFRRNKITELKVTYERTVVLEKGTRTSDWKLPECSELCLPSDSCAH